MNRRSAWLVFIGSWIFTATVLAENPALTTARPPIDPDYLARLARRIEPDLEGHVERVSQYVEFFRQQLANDTRLFAFQVDAQMVDEHHVRLTGYVEFPETRAALLGFLDALSVSVAEHQIRTLPSSSLGEETFGFLMVPQRFSTAEPGRGETVTECLYAEPLLLLDEFDGQMLVHSQEGYLGYIPANAIRQVAAEEFTQYTSGRRAIVQHDYKALDGQQFRAGTQLKWISESGDQVTVALPDGTRTMLPVSICLPEEDRSAAVEKALQNAVALLGTPYQWGGKTSAGIDCSGLVQLAFQSAGIHLPRDANQQFLVGRLTATRWYLEGLQRGDTMYFVGPHGRIRHTAVYLGEGNYLQAESPVVTITSLNPHDANYDARRRASFVFAKRLF